MQGGAARLRLGRGQGLRNASSVRASVAALGGAHGVEHVPLGGAEGPAAARGRTHGSRPRATARRAGPRLRGGGWCCTRCGAQCGAVCAWPPSAGRFGLAWHAGGAWGRRRGARGRRAARARSFFGRWGALSAHAALRGPRARPSLSATRALCGRGDMKNISWHHQVCEGGPFLGALSLRARASAGCGTPKRAQPAGVPPGPRHPLPSRCPPGRSYRDACLGSLHSPPSAWLR